MDPLSRGNLVSLTHPGVPLTLQFISVCFKETLIDLDKVLFFNVCTLLGKRV